MRWTWWKVVLWAIAIVLAFELICEEQHPPAADPVPGRVDTLVVSRVDTLVVRDTVREPVPLVDGRVDVLWSSAQPWSEK